MLYKEDEKEEEDFELDPELKEQFPMLSSSVVMASLPYKKCTCREKKQAIKKRPDQKRRKGNKNKRHHLASLWI